MSADEKTIIAYAQEIHHRRLTGNLVDEIRPAPHQRAWMNDTPDRYAYRCIPVGVANTVGWEILNPVHCDFYWNGDIKAEGVRVQHYETKLTNSPSSHFGSGIVTWNIPFVFRTPPEVGLMVTGPANHLKDGMVPIEALVETDWLPNSFTMNWKITVPEKLVTFEKGEPICRIFPYPKNYVDQFQIEIRNLKDDPEFGERVADWEVQRREGRSKVDLGQGEVDYKEAFDTLYAKGRDVAGNVADDHKNILECKKVRDARGT